MNKNQSYYLFRLTFYTIPNFKVAFIALLLLLGGSPLASAQTINADFRASADKFLRRLTAAEHLRMGDSAANSISGANALNSNPAGLSFIDSNHLITHTSRFPRTIAVIAKLNEVERYEDHSQYALPASGLEFVNYSRRLGTAGAIGFNFAVGHEGRFSRVNHLGKATNSFPETDFAVGLSYAVKPFRRFAIGADANWLRSKVQDTESERHIGHGYAYNLGLIQQLGEHLRIGAVVRNLSNGLSFTDNSIPDRIRRDILLGGTYQFHYKDVDIHLDLELNPPFGDGLRTNFGGTVWYRDFIGGRIGYLRHTEKRFGSVLSLETGQVDSEDRIWKTEGLSLGLGLQVRGFYINAAYTPQLRPVENDGEQIRIETGKSVYSFSIGQRF